MFDSAKFLLPSVTAGLPAPGAELALVVPVSLLEFELPHAASSTPASTIAITVRALSPTRLNFTDLPSVIRCLQVLLVVDRWKLMFRRSPPPKSLRRSSRDRAADCAP